MQTAIALGYFGQPVRYPAAPEQQKAYADIYGRLQKVQVGPFKVGGAVPVGPYRAFDDPNADEFARALVDGVAAAMRSEPARAAVIAAVKSPESVAAVRGAIKPVVIGAYIVGGLGLLAGAFALVRSFRR